MPDAFLEDLPGPHAMIRAELDNATSSKPHLLLAVRQAAAVHPVEDGAKLGPLALGAVLVNQPFDRRDRLA